MSTPRAIELKFRAEALLSRMIAAGDMPDCRWAERLLVCEVGEQGKAIRLSAKVGEGFVSVLLPLWSGTGKPVEPADREITQAWYRIGLATMRRPGAARVE